MTEAIFMKCSGEALLRPLPNLQSEIETAILAFYENVQ
jgi:hypothetical protein